MNDNFTTNCIKEFNEDITHLNLVSVKAKFGKWLGWVRVTTLTDSNLIDALRGLSRRIADQFGSAGSNYSKEVFDITLNNHSDREVELTQDCWMHIFQKCSKKEMLEGTYFKINRVSRGAFCADYRRRVFSWEISFNDLNLQKSPQAFNRIRCRKNIISANVSDCGFDSKELTVLAKERKDIQALALSHIGDLSALKQFSNLERLQVDLRGNYPDPIWPLTTLKSLVIKNALYLDNVSFLTNLKNLQVTFIPTMGDSNLPSLLQTKLIKIQNCWLSNNKETLLDFIKEKIEGVCYGYRYESDAKDIILYNSDQMTEAELIRTACDFLELLKKRQSFDYLALSSAVKIYQEKY